MNKIIIDLVIPSDACFNNYNGIAEKLSLRAPKGRSNLVFKIASLTSFVRNDAEIDFFSNPGQLNCMFKWTLNRLEDAGSVEDDNDNAVDHYGDEEGYQRAKPVTLILHYAFAA